MIQTEKLIPQVYYDESRDFQVLGRLFDAIANYDKANIDIMLAPLGRNLSSQLISLMATLVGFTPRHDYDAKDLAAVCSGFRNLIKKKGSKTAIDNAVLLLVNSQGIDIKYDDLSSIELDDTRKSKHTMQIYVPKQLKDINLLEDLFDYILPAGWLYRIVTVDNSKASTSMDVSMKEECNIEKLSANKAQITKLDDGKIVNPESKTYLSTISGRRGN